MEIGAADNSIVIEQKKNQQKAVKKIKCDQNN